MVHVLVWECYDVDNAALYCSLPNPNRTCCCETLWAGIITTLMYLLKLLSGITFAVAVVLAICFFQWGYSIFIFWSMTGTRTTLPPCIVVFIKALILVTRIAPAVVLSINWCRWDWSSCGFLSVTFTLRISLQFIAGFTTVLNMTCWFEELGVEWKTTTTRQHSLVTGLEFTVVLLTRYSGWCYSRLLLGSATVGLFASPLSVVVILISPNMMNLVLRLSGGTKTTSDYVLIFVTTFAVMLSTGSCLRRWSRYIPWYLPTALLMSLLFIGVITTARILTCWFEELRLRMKTTSLCPLVLVTGIAFAVFLSINYCRPGYSSFISWSVTLTLLIPLLFFTRLTRASNMTYWFGWMLSEMKTITMRMLARHCWWRQ